MRVSVIPFAKAIEPQQVENKTVIVIDVLRATSVMIKALQNGAKEIIPCKTVKEAKAMANILDEGRYLLCGERDAIKIDGFDLGNSPLEYTADAVNGKTIFLTTTNGTRALHACSRASEILIGAFLNVNSIVEQVKHQEELALVCSGTKGKFSLDDGMCAAMIMDKLSKNHFIETDDLGNLLLDTLRKSNRTLKKILNGCKHLNFLIENGFDADVDYCLQLDIVASVPTFNGRNVSL